MAKVWQFAVCALFAGALTGVAFTAFGGTRATPVEKQQSAREAQDPEARQSPIEQTEPSPIRAAVVAPTPVTSTNSGTETDSPPRANPHVAAPEPPEEERLAFANSAFEAESVDRAWASGSRQQIEQQTAAVRDPNAHVRQVDCRSTLCRVEIDVSGGGRTAEAYLRRLIRGNLLGGMAMATRTPADATGRVALTVFMAKPGTELPEPPSPAE